jgi:hypothetical protein
MLDLQGEPDPAGRHVPMGPIVIDLDLWAAVS